MTVRFPLSPVMMVGDQRSADARGAYVGKGYCHSLLVGLQTGSATPEIMAEYSQVTKNKCTR